MVAGGKVSQIDPESAGVNPAWRKAVVEATCTVYWDEGASSKEIEGEIFQLKAWIKSLHDVSPNDGAYFNEVGSKVLSFALTNWDVMLRRLCLRSIGKPHFSGLIILN